MKRLQSYTLGNWIEGTGNFSPLYNAITGEEIFEVSTEGIDRKSMLDYGREIGGPKLRDMTFHERGRMLKALAQYLMERKDELYPFSYMTGATKIDSWIDIEGGISTLFVFASKGRRELPNEKIWVEGNMEPLSKNGTFIGQHICTPFQGVAVHINAFNFPVWGMLEKLAPTFLAGMPAIVKPSSLSSYLTESAVRMMIESEILPEGSLQLLCGDHGDLLDHVQSQDVVTFTGSAETGHKLKVHPAIVQNSVRFNMEADSLNCSILGTDVTPDMEEFNIFIKEVVNEMTTKAGQKCTAIRRTFVPSDRINDVVEALKQRLSKVKVGDPSKEGIRMGALADKLQVSQVREKSKILKSVSEIVYEGVNEFDSKSDEAFISPLLLQCNNPFDKDEPHEVEAFGPVNTVMPYNDLDEAIRLPLITEE
jgi:oxepin-CoA hydrolase/3-oxo-5,6-dehydrosuberyl-CoA semialdehyde dehydrogenase